MTNVFMTWSKDPKKRKMCDKHCRYFRSAPRNMRPCFSGGKWCVARSVWELVPQARKFKYLGVLFMRDEKMEQERWTGGLGRPLLKCRRFTGLLWCSRVQPQGEAFDLLVCLRSDPHLWSWALGSDRMDKVADTSSRNEVRPQSDSAWP